MSKGLVTGKRAGTTVLTVNRPGHSTTIPVTITGVAPAYVPAVGDRMLIDTRVGGANDLQAAGVTTLAQAKATFPDGLFDAANGMARFLANSDLGAKVFAHDAYGFARETLTQVVTAVATTTSAGIAGSGAAQSVQVASSAGFAIGDVIHIDGPKALYPNQYTGAVGSNGCPWEPVTITAIPDGTHISGVFTLNHALGAVIAKEQTVPVTNSGPAQTGRTIGAGYGTANQEAVFLRSKAAGTLTAAFAKNHAIGDALAYCRDMGVGKLFTYFPPNQSQAGVRPRTLFVQFKHRMGRTASDAGGLGAIDAAALYNGFCDFVQNFDPSQSNSNAGRKFFLAEREIEASAGLDRIGLLWGGANGATVNPNFDTDASSYAGVTQFGNPAPTVNPSAWIGHTVTHTLMIVPESSRDAADGTIDWWVSVDGGATTQVASLVGKKIGPEAFDRIEVLPTFNSIRQDVTEYSWDYVVWERPWVGTVPPSRPTSAPVFVNAAATTMTLTVPVPQGCDTLRFFAGGANMGVQGTYYVGPQMGADVAVTPADWGTNKTVTVSGLTGATAYTGICVSAGLGGKFSTQSAGLVTASTI